MIVWSELQKDNGDAVVQIWFERFPPEVQVLKFNLHHEVRENLIHLWCSEVGL